MAELYGWDIEYIQTLSRRTIDILLEVRKLNKERRDEDYEKRRQAVSADNQRRKMLNG